MPAGEIAKRFTLTDLLGYLLSGVVLIALGGAYWLLQTTISTTPAWATRLSTAHDSLDSLGKIVVFVVASYVLGVASVETGSLLYQVWKRITKWWDPQRDRPLLFLKGDTWALEPTLQERLLAKVQDVVGISRESAPPVPLQEKSQVSIAYSHLIVNGRDGFVQLMSGRSAMFRGLTGATTWFALATILHRFLVDVASDTAFVLTLIGCVGIVAVGLGKVRLFDNWWDRHVVFGFLASDVETKEPEKTESKSDNPSTAAVVTVTVAGTRISDTTS